MNEPTRPLPAASRRSPHTVVPIHPRDWVRMSWRARQRLDELRRAQVRHAAACRPEPVQFAFIHVRPPDIRTMAEIILRSLPTEDADQVASRRAVIDIDTPFDHPGPNPASPHSAAHAAHLRGIRDPETVALARAYWRERRAASRARAREAGAA